MPPITDAHVSEVRALYKKRNIPHDRKIIYCDAGKPAISLNEYETRAKSDA